MSPARIRQHIPEGRKEPALLERFVRAKLGVTIQWDSLKGYDLNREVKKQIVPFMRLDDGGVVALWYHAASPAVVQIGSEGETEVLAATFEQFVKAINAGCSGIMDFDERDDKFVMPGIKGAKPQRPAALQKQFDALFDQGEKPDAAEETKHGQALLKRICKIARQMVKDGTDSTWSTTYRAVPTAAGLELSYIKMSKSLPYVRYPTVPKKYKLEPEIEAIIKLCKHKSLDRYDISVSNEFLYVNTHGKELILMTPKKRERLAAYRADERSRRRSKS